MSYGYSALLAITIVGTLYGAQLRLFDKVLYQVDQINQLETYAVYAADSVSPGVEAFYEQANKQINSFPDTMQAFTN